MKKTASILAIALVLALALSACKKDPDPDDGGGGEPCACAPKEHYLPCTCGGTDCTCAIKPRGYIAEDQSDTQVPIYQTAGVTDEQAIATTGEITSVWNKPTNNGIRIACKGKVKEVWIVKAAGPTNEYYDYEYAIDGNKVILKIQYNNEYIDDSFYVFATQVLPGLEL